MSPNPETHPTSVLARTLTQEERPEFTGRLFGKDLTLIGELSVFNFMARLSPGYSGGFWDFKEGADGALYMAPPGPDGYLIEWEGNGYEGRMSADAAGIVATLFTLSHLSFAYASDHIVTAFERLRDLASEHPEAVEIFRAID